MINEQVLYDEQIGKGVTDFEKLRERLHRTGFVITIHLRSVDKRDLGLCVFTERLEDRCVFLTAARMSEPQHTQEWRELHTVTSRMIFPSSWSARAFQSTCAISPCQIAPTKSEVEICSSCWFALRASMICVIHRSDMESIKCYKETNFVV